MPVLRGLQTFYLVRAEHKTARELGEQLLTLAQRVQDPVFLLGAHFALGQTLYNLGELASAQEHLEQGIALRDPQQYRSLAWAGAHPGGWPAYPMRPGSYGILAIRTRLSREATKLSLSLRSYLTPTA